MPGFPIRFTLELSPEMFGRLARFADRSGRSKKHIITEALAMYLLPRENGGERFTVDAVRRMAKKIAGMVDEGE